MSAPRRVILGPGLGAPVESLLRPAAELASRLGSPLVVAYGADPALRELQRLPPASGWHVPRLSGLDSPEDLGRALRAAAALTRRAALAAAARQGVHVELLDLDASPGGLVELVSERDVVLLQRRGRSFGASGLPDLRALALAAQLRGAALLPGPRGFWPAGPLPEGMLERPVTLVEDWPEHDVIQLLQAWLPRVALRVRRLSVQRLVEGEALRQVGTLVLRRQDLKRLEAELRRPLDREELSLLIV